LTPPRQARWAASSDPAAAAAVAFTTSPPICWAARTESPTADIAVELNSRVAPVTPPSAVASVSVTRLTAPLPAEVRGRAFFGGDWRPRVDTDSFFFLAAGGFFLEVRPEVSFPFFFLVAMAPPPFDNLLVGPAYACACSVPRRIVELDAAR
jgi:hypothetical protein